MRAVKLNVLIVEDNVVNQKVLKKQLQRLGWGVSVAGNGQEALDWLKDTVYWQIERSKGSDTDQPLSHSKHKIDVILMDVEMPIMDGQTCARLIRDYEHQGVLAFPRPPNYGPRSSSASSISPISASPDSMVASGYSNQRSLRIPIIAVSANARMEQVEQIKAAGMDAAISKPFRIPELWPCLRELVPRLR